MESSSVVRPRPPKKKKKKREEPGRSTGASGKGWGWGGGGSNLKLGSVTLAGGLMYGRWASSKSQNGGRIKRIVVQVVGLRMRRQGGDLQVQKGI